MTKSHSIHGRTVLTIEALEDRLTPSSTSVLSSVYNNLLHRAPAASDLAYWVPQLDSGTPASAVTAAVVASPEYQGDFIRSSYQQFLNHDPSSSALSWWEGQTVCSGVADPQAEAMILASPEFVQEHPGATNAWINAVYQQALGRPAGPADLTYWNGVLQNGASNLNVALSIVKSPEANARCIRDAYQQLLGRDADAAALTFWGRVANNPEGMALVLAGIASSPECVNHASATSAAAGGNSGTGPVSSDPYCADPYQFTGPGGDDGVVSCNCDTGGGDTGGDNNGYSSGNTSGDTSGNTNFDFGNVLDLGGLADITG
jgi:hypothetical protein